MFRKMRRSIQELPREEALAILENGQTAVLAVIGDRGYPYSVPVNYAYAKGKIYIHGADSGHKTDAIRSCDKVSLCVIEEDTVIPEKATTAYRSVVVFGKARLLETREEILAGTEIIGRKYCGNLPIVDRELSGQNITLSCIEITPEHITGKEGKERMKLRK